MNTQTAAALGIFAGMTMMLMSVGIVLWVLLIIAHWRMFTKAGEEGWKAIIPVYSDFVLFKIVWNTKSFWIYFGAAIATVLINVLGGQYVVVDGQIVSAAQGNFFVGLLSFISSLILLLYTILLQIKTALAYGKGIGFAVGLLLLPNIFTLILGFGSAEYLGPQE